MPARLRLLIPVLLLALLAGGLRAQSPAPTTVQAPHLTVSLLVPPAQIYPGQSFTAGLRFQMEPGWHVYWINAGDSGEPPAIHWKLPAGITAAALEFPPPKRLPLGPLMDFGYDGTVIFPVPIAVGSDFRPSGPHTILGGHVTWLVCREVCIPGKADLAVTRVATATAPTHPDVDASAQALIAEFRDHVPQPLPAADSADFRQTPRGFELQLLTGSPDSSAEFFPLDQAVIANAAPQPATPVEKGVRLTLTKDASLQSAPPKLNGIIELPGGKSYEIHAVPGSASAPAAVASTAAPSGFAALLGAAGFAFLGGILLNLMPCVFPVLFIKGLALVQSSHEERSRLRTHGWVYTLGILVSFWTIVAVLLGLRAAGRQLGWGFQFQSPTFVALMAMLLFFLGLALAGQFEIGLSMTSAGGSLAQKHGYAGSFFTGVLAMVVATPCTAPFMGAAVGYALAHSAAVSFTVFTTLALGLALPYLLLAHNPGWTRLLPKPGPWMEILKQAVSVLIFGTVIWLVWVYLRVAGTGLSLIALLVAFLLLAVAGWFLGRWPGRTGPAVIAIVIVAAAIAVPVSILRALPAPSVETTAGFSIGSASEAAHSASDWQPFTPTLLAQYRSQGRPVFVDFTASWCLSCQVNERVILDRADVRRKLHDSGVALLRADWTNQDPQITEALAALGRSGVPTYAIYPADPSVAAHVLPEVLTPGIVMDALQSMPPVRNQPPLQSASQPAPPAAGAPAPQSAPQPAVRTF